MFKKLFGFRNFLLGYNGRILDTVFSETLTHDDYVLGNSYYMTFEKALNFRDVEYYEVSRKDNKLPFVCIDYVLLEKIIKEKGKKPKVFHITAPDLSGRYVKPDELKTLRNILGPSVIFSWDAARFNENSYMILKNTNIFKSWEISDMSQYFASFFDIIILSAKKTLQCPMGGVILFKTKKQLKLVKKIHI